MDPINIIIGLNVIATFGANIGGAQKGLKTKFVVSKEKPETYLQKLPLILSALTLIALIIALFQIGTLEYTDEMFPIRIAGLIVYLVFSWTQIWSFKTLGANYSQDVMIKKDHQLVEKGPYKFIRHPQYLSQILLDLGAAAATLSFIILPIVLLEVPFLVMRASLEEKLHRKHFGEKFKEYKTKSGFFIPFIG